MTPLADALALLHAAPNRFRTLRATSRVWEHTGRFQLACTAAGVVGRSIHQSCLFDSEGTKEHEVAARLWIDGPDRFRLEEDQPGASTSILVADGDQWRCEGAGGRLVGGDDGRPPPHANGLSHVLATATHPAWLHYEVAGDGEQAGRPCLHLVARSREFPRSPTRVERLVGDRRNLLVDAVTGVVLRTESQIDGSPFFVAEFTAAAFDEPMPASLFALEGSSCHDRHRNVGSHG